ncbi:hypothetical protein ES703_44315 [subsurface metagenome]
MTTSNILKEPPLICQAPPGEIPHYPPEPQPLAHRNLSPPISLTDKKEREPGSSRDLYSYGVPMKRKILTVEIYNRRFHEIRHYLEQNIGLTLAERESIFRLLRIYAYYGRVYPKASQIADDFGNMTKGCSKRSFWRAIGKLEGQGLVQVCNRYLHGRQISNCYRLDKLILCLVRWLLEHGSRYLNLEKLARELYDVLHGANFWRLIWSAKADLSKATPVRLNQEGGTP